ncbi:MAG TPA: antitoxin [Propionibacteriaceae bacterium]|nr:antitoxin [Propionibacteriaceae bacterium]
MGIFDKAKDALGDHPEVVDKAGDFVDDKTGNKYTSQIDQGETFVEGHLADPNDPAVTETKVVE